MSAHKIERYEIAPGMWVRDEVRVECDMCGQPSGAELCPECEAYVGATKDIIVEDLR